MTKDSSTVRFRFDAQKDKIEQLNEEIDSAPTYSVQFDKEEQKIKITPLNDDDSVLTVDEETRIDTLSLHKKLAESPIQFSVDEASEDKRYKFRGVLGKGGTGYVFEMADVNIGRSVAVKILKDIRSQEDLKSFIHEGRLGASDRARS